VIAFVKYNDLMHYTKKQQHDTRQRNRRTSMLDVRRRRHGGDYNNNTRPAFDWKGQIEEANKEQYGYVFLICGYMTNTTVVSKQTIL
jgi:hypothetical protein